MRAVRTDRVRVTLMSTPSFSSAGERRLAFVTGGSGFLGGRLIEVLTQRGWRVRALARSEAAAGRVEALGAEAARGDLLDEAALTGALAGCAVAFHAAAHFKLWGPRAEFDRVNVAGTRALLEAARKAPGLRRVVAVGAAAVVIGQPRPVTDATESLPLLAPAFAPYSASKAEAERLVLAANGSRDGFSTIVVRPPTIWGAGMPTLDQLAEAIAAGRWRWVAGGGQAMSTAHVDNVCHALLLAAERGRGGEAYFVSDGQDGTVKGVFSAFLATRGLAAPDASVPFPVAWAMAGLMGAAWRAFRLAGEPPLTRQLLQLIGHPLTLDIAKARGELGYAPVVSWADGLAAMRASAAPPAVRAPAPSRAA